MSELAPPPSPRVRRGQLLDAVVRRERHISRLIAEQRMDIARLSREDRGGIAARYVSDELAMAWHRSPRQARSREDTALVFVDFPDVIGLVEDGTWLIDHADAVIDELIGSGLAREEQQQVLDLVLERLRACTPWELRVAVRTAIVVLFPDRALDRAAKAQADRDVRMYAGAPGAASLHVSGPTHEVAAIWASVDAFCGPPAPGDDRTLRQRRFDALRDLACGRIQPANWQVQLLVEAATVEGHDEMPGEVVGLGPVPAAVARDVAASGTLRRVVVDSGGRPVAVDGEVHRPDQAPAREPFRQRWDWTEPDPDEAADPDPDAPSATDLDWYDGHPEHAAAVEDIICLAMADTEPLVLDEPATSSAAADSPPLSRDAAFALLKRTAGSEPPPARHVLAPSPYSGVWSPGAFTAAVQTMRTSRVWSVDLSTDRYVVPRRLKRLLELRDKTCVFPGCPRLAAKCDKDHLIPWPRGRTETANLLDECDHHHHGKHEHFTVTLLPDGTVRWTAPCGVYADRPPRPVLEAWRFRSPPSPS